MLGMEKPPCLCPVIGVILLLLGDCHFREEKNTNWMHDQNDKFT